MKAPLIAIVLCHVSAAVCAQSANETAAGLQSCFQSARRADVICANPGNDPAQRLDCLQKARTAQLECLRQVLPEASAGSAASEKTAAIGGSGFAEKASGGSCASDTDESC